MPILDNLDRDETFDWLKADSCQRLCRWLAIVAIDSGWQLTAIDAQAEITQIVPPGGIVQGGMAVSLRGRNFEIFQSGNTIDDTKPYCKFGSSSAVEGMIKTVLGKKLVVCESPAAPEGKAGIVAIEVSLNNQQFSSSDAATLNKFRYYEQVVIKSAGAGVDLQWGGPSCLG